MVITLHEGPATPPRRGDDIVLPDATQPPVAAGTRKRRPVRQTRPRVAWYATLLIVMTLLLGAGWELWRWLLLIITLD